LTLSPFLGILANIDDLLKKQIIEKWVDIRARAFVKTFVKIVRKSIRNTNDKDKKTF